MVWHTACRSIACAVAVMAVTALSTSDAFAGWNGYGSHGSSGGSWGSSGGSWGSSGHARYASYGSSGRVGPIRRLFRALHPRRHASWGCSGGYSSSGGYASSGGSRGYYSSGSSGVYRSYASSGSSGGYRYSASSGGSSGGAVPYYQPSGPSVVPGPTETTASRLYSAGSARLAKLETKDATLNVKLPEDAKVFVNGRLTTTPGQNRRYVSRNLPVGQTFTYEVKAVVERDGKEVAQTKVIDLFAGADKNVNFDFDSQDLITSLTLEVPENARVTMSGHDTQLEGSIRYFSTKELKEGQKWEDYEIKVTVEKDGKPTTMTRKVNLVAGESKLVSFTADEEVKVASRNP